MKQNIIEEISLFLLRKGFTIKNIKAKICFDIVARKGSQILLIKILEDINSLNPIAINEMKNLANYLGASPIIVAEKSGSELNDNIVYSRFNVYCVNLFTFKNCIDKKMPFVKSTKAGLTVSIFGNRLKELCENKDISLNYLSRKIGVSGKMIKKYENGSAEISLSKALKLYSIFGNSVFKEVNLFSVAIENLSKICRLDISKKYLNLGFKTLETKKSPFDIIAKNNSDIIFTEIGDKVNKNLQPVTSLLDAKDLIIFKKKKPKDIPALKKDEFLEFEKAKELIKFIEEFE